MSINLRKITSFLYGNGLAHLGLHMLSLAALKRGS